PPPRHTPLDEDPLTLAQRGPDPFSRPPEHDHVDPADVGLPSVPVTDMGRHGEPTARHRRAIRGILHLRVPDQITEEVHARQRSHTWASSGPPLQDRCTNGGTEGVAAACQTVSRWGVRAVWDGAQAYGTGVRSGLLGQGGRPRAHTGGYGISWSPPGRPW